MLDLIACEKDIDIAIICEPNVAIMKRKGLIYDLREDVAVFIKNKNLEVISVARENGFIKIGMEKWDLYCCYFSPNRTLDEFRRYFDGIFTRVKNEHREAIILGDMNAKSGYWGSPVTDARGRVLEEWTAELDLVVINTGLAPTFVRNASESFIDVTMATPSVAKYIKGWRVLEGEFFTCHNHIYFEIVMNNGRRVKTKKHNKPIFDPKKFEVLLKEKVESRVVNTIHTISHDLEMITKACQVNPGINEHEKPYWWTAEIENKRRDCSVLRRRSTRANRLSSIDDQRKIQMAEDYKQAKKELKNTIAKRKREAWKTLCDGLEDDIFGDGYKIALRHMGRLSLPFKLPVNRKMEVARELFPQCHNEIEKYPEAAAVNERITIEELKYACAKMKTGRAPGPDGVPAEAIKILVTAYPDIVLDAMNDVLVSQELPACWKLAKLTLLWKGAGLSSASDFRPICLLNTLGKTFERIIKERLETSIAERGGFSPRQFGFVKGASTVHAVKTVVDRAANSRKTWVALIALDVKNAFNSASWRIILEKLRKWGIQQYLINIVGSYFAERRIMVAREKHISVTAGVPQGSVLGPLLWNVLYDDVLKIDTMKEMECYAFADDLAVVVEADSPKQLTDYGNEALRIISRWMRINELKLAPQKTEAVILKGRGDRRGVRFEILGNSVTPKKSIKYLGVTLDERLTFADHVKCAVAKAEKRMAALARIMPNIAGPSTQKRLVLNGVVTSILLYGAPVWLPALNIARYKSMLESTQRKMLLRVICGYRTISTCAVQVVAGVPPLSLLVEERAELFASGRECTEVSKREARSRTVAKWQQIWEEHSDTAQWTKKLIPDIRKWLQCKHRNTDYYLTQFLTGHGRFGSYTHRMAIKDSDACNYCGLSDTPEHTVFVCVRWSAQRSELERSVGAVVDPVTVVGYMIEKEAHFKAVSRFVKYVLSKKEQEERNGR